MNVVPISPSPCFRFSVTLDSYPLTMRLKWNYISSQWFMDIDCAALGLAYHGFALVTDNDILEGRGVTELGKLILIDLQGSADPGYDGLGDRWKLYYITKAEVDAA